MIPGVARNFQQGRGRIYFSENSLSENFILQGRGRGRAGKVPFKTSKTLGVGLKNP